MENQDQQAIRAIRTNFLKYIREKNWSAIEPLLTPEARFTSNMFHHSFLGCGNIIECLHERFQGQGEDSDFHLHTPEITITGPDRAFGMWHLTERNKGTTGTGITYRIGYVHDRYEKHKGVWKLAFSYHEIQTNEFVPPSISGGGFPHALPLAG